MRGNAKSQLHGLHTKALTTIPWIKVLVLSTMLCGCNRPLLHKLIDKFGSKQHEKPTVYHEYEGYSPGAKRSTVEENFDRYYYYIATPYEETTSSEPEIVFRQDYEDIDVQPPFDEEQYWKDHPLIIDNDN